MANKLNILYAEDDDFGAALTREILEKQDFIVTIAPDGSLRGKRTKSKNRIYS